MRICLCYINTQKFFYTYLYMKDLVGIPVIESMACGVPTITSDTSSIREIAGDAAILIIPTGKPKSEMQLFDFSMISSFMNP